MGFSSPEPIQEWLGSIRSAPLPRQSRQEYPASQTPHTSISCSTVRTPPWLLRVRDTAPGTSALAREGRADRGWREWGQEKVFWNT